MRSDFYVYALLDPRKPGNYIPFNYEPFYIGKGTGERCKVHLWNVKRNSEINKHKSQKIQKIINQGLEPLIHILYESLTELDAYRIEEEYIEQFGRLLDGGCLTNIKIAHEGEGSSGWNNPVKNKTWEEAYGEDRAAQMKLRHREAQERIQKNPDYYEKRKEAIKHSIATKDSNNPEWRKEQAERVRKINTPDIIARRSKTLSQKIASGEISTEGRSQRRKLFVGILSPTWKGWYYDPENDISYDSTITASNTLDVSRETITNRVRRGEFLLLAEPRGDIKLGKYPPVQAYIDVLGYVPEAIGRWVYSSIPH
jgi:hypothetical protein